jgi:hypothetical protein
MDDELGWCIITNWGVDYTMNIEYYTPVASTDPAADEHHASVFEILALLKQSTTQPKNIRLSSIIFGGSCKNGVGLSSDETRSASIW